ncbi:hypothetical protein BDV25DRAFT_150278 [Aspergillus avenaceus]|uniref:Uncharacterized protein n=1 Tax=Aspergillus avenaceus TaxID=36643 RepID=A0A5N6U427_ASPAV|nr:hypothetical protein BDV25DRAFT_150278 [Aspergillus avenaceus]
MQMSYCGRKGEKKRTDCLVRVVCTLVVGTAFSLVVSNLDDLTMDNELMLFEMESRWSKF